MTFKELVALLVSAWIETQVLDPIREEFGVALLVSAWIETIPWMAHT